MPCTLLLTEKSNPTWTTLKQAAVRIVDTTNRHLLTLSLVQRQFLGYLWGPLESFASNLKSLAARTNASTSFWRAEACTSKRKRSHHILVDSPTEFSSFSRGFIRYGFVHSVPLEWQFRETSLNPGQRMSIMLRDLYTSSSSS